MQREKAINISDFKKLPIEETKKIPEKRRKSPKDTRWDEMTERERAALKKRQQRIDRFKSQEKRFLELKESGKLKEIFEEKEDKKRNYKKNEKKIIDKMMNAMFKKTIEKNKLEKEATEQEIIEVLKNNRIDQIIIGGEKVKNKEGKNVTGYSPDLDARTALYILDNYNIKGDKAYNEKALVSIINKDNSGQDLIPNKKGLKIFLDVGGTWMKVEKNGEATTLRLDHHGSGKGEKTSSAKMLFDLMRKGKLVKEIPGWLSKFINSVNEIDNLSYLDKKDDKKRKTFTESYFRNEWPNSLFALAEKNIPFSKLIELFESKLIKDPSVPFTKEELDGKLGKTIIGDKTIAELCKEKAEKVEETIKSIKNSEKHLSAMGIDTKNTIVGDIVYHNFPEMEYKNGKKFINTIPEKLDFIGTKALGKDTYISWNEKKQSFFIDSFHPNLSKIIKALNEKDPGCALDVRGTMVFGTINKLTEEEFLDIIDPKILKNSKIKKQEDISNEKEAIWTEKNELERQKLMAEIEQIKNEIIDIDREIEKIKQEEAEEEIISENTENEEVTPVEEKETTNDTTVQEETLNNEVPVEPNENIIDTETPEILEEPIISLEESSVVPTTETNEAQEDDLENTQTVEEDSVEVPSKTTEGNEIKKSYSFEEINDEIKQYFLEQQNVTEIKNLKVIYQDNQISISGSIEMNLVVNGKNTTDKINLIKLTLANKGETIETTEINTLTGYANSLRQNPRVIEMIKKIENIPNAIIQSIEEKEGRKIEKINIEGKELIIL
jgi:hypothetical protein